MTAFDQFVTVIDPRLTGSPSHKAAAGWAQSTLAAWGLNDAHLEPWEFGRGWVLDRQIIELLEPRYMPLIGYAEAWSAPTKGELVANPVSVAGRTAADVAAMRDRLAGAIVLTQPVQTGFVREDRLQPSMSQTPVPSGAPRMPPSGGGNLAQALRDTGAGVLLCASAGEHGTVLVLGTDRGANAVPSMVLAAEHYNMIERMVEEKLPVKLRVAIQSHYLTADTKSYNVIADLPGSDPVLKNEIVLVDGHLDFWHTGTGASDNADGAAAVMEALRILKAVGARPRHVIAGITNTDHLSFKAFGIPGFTPIQDYVTYDGRTHRTNVDTYERVREQDLKQNAVSLAWFASNGAIMDARFSREVAQPFRAAPTPREVPSRK